MTPVQEAVKEYAAMKEYFSICEHNQEIYHLWLDAPTQVGKDDGAWITYLDEFKKFRDLHQNYGINNAQALLNL